MHKSIINKIKHILAEIFTKNNSCIIFTALNSINCLIICSKYLPAKTCILS